MLITPHVVAKGDEYLSPPVNPKVLVVSHKIPDLTGDLDIKLAEGNWVTFFKVHSPTTVEILGEYRLVKFDVRRGTAQWEFQDALGAIYEGGFHSISLAPRLSVKLKIPIILLNSKAGLRTTFYFRVDPDHQVMPSPRFRELVGIKR
jgi:hypothetical protein